MTTLLIVDDESWVRDTIKTLVTRESSPFKDLEIKEAKNGIEALEFFKNNPPDLMITDMKMPGIDGKQLLETIEAKYTHLPIIVLSGYDDFVYAKQAIRSKVIEYLLKPVNEIELFQAIEKALQQKESSEKQQINYYMLSINRPEISEIIQPFHRSIYFDFKETNKLQFMNRMQQFSSSIDESLKTDESFIFQLQQRFLTMLEEVMQEFQLRLEDLEVELTKLSIDPGASFEQVIENQHDIGFSIIHLIDQSKKRKNRINLEEIKQYIDQQYDTNNLSLDEVAKKFFVSKEYLTTVFKQKYGYNITEYIITLRMEMAKELIKNTTMQYKIIAEKVGYDDVPYFYRVFKRYYHISPGEMRRT